MAGVARQASRTARGGRKSVNRAGHRPHTYAESGMQREVPPIHAIALWSWLLCITCLGPAIAADIDPRLEAIRHVGPRGAGHRAAKQAAAELSRGDISLLPQVLEAMDGAGPLAENWLRGVAEAQVQHALAAGQAIPLDKLQAYIRHVEHSPRGRRLAFELLRQQDQPLADAMIPEWLDDPSLELRREAIEQSLQRAKNLDGQSKPDDALLEYLKVFRFARDLDHIQKIAENLERLGATPDIADHMGFITQWHVIGPFDNTNKQGFDVVYPPEKEIDLQASYPGVTGDISWKPLTTDDAYGLVDLNTGLGNHKGAIAYAFAEFHSSRERDVQFRLGCINGNKVWLNGELLTANHVYHANTFVDQYLGQGRLRAGRNEILVKIAQNEQTEDWAQRWSFQLRVCDAIGTAVLSGK
jgi:hypothetical protein